MPAAAEDRPERLDGPVLVAPEDAQTYLERFKADMLCGSGSKVYSEAMKIRSDGGIRMVNAADSRPDAIARIARRMAFGRHHSSRTCSSCLCSQPRGADDGRTCGRGAFVTTAPAPNHFSGGRPLSGRSDLIVRAMRPDDVETLALLEGRVEESPWSAGNF